MYLNDQLKVISMLSEFASVPLSITWFCIGFLSCLIVALISISFIRKRAFEAGSHSQQPDILNLKEHVDSLTWENDALNDEFIQLRKNIENNQQLIIQSAVQKNVIEEKNIQLAQLNAELSSKQNLINEIQSINIKLHKKNIYIQTTLLNERKSHEDKLTNLMNTREQVKFEFQAMAETIFEQKGKQFSDQNREKLFQLLTPLEEQLKHFDQKVTDTYSRESDQQHHLINEVKNLKELNEKMRHDTMNFTQMLKGQTHTQGVWGEMLLTRVLEISGLRDGHEFHTQANYQNDMGKTYRPDVVLKLPKDRQIIIDSKVSLTAYSQYSAETDQHKQSQLIKQHLQSIKNHIKQLSDKEYQNLQDIDGLDFVFMFVPIEAAYLLIMENDQQLFQYAFDKNVVMVGPTSLLATVKTIQNIWSYESQNKNAKIIAQKAGSLYDKFVAFVGDLEEVSQKLNQSHHTFNEAFSKLYTGRGNIMSRVQDLKKLGAKTTKSLPESLLIEDECNPSIPIACSHDLN